VRVHHRPALDQDPRPVPSAAAAGVTPRRAELSTRAATSGDRPEQPNMRRQVDKGGASATDRVGTHPPRAPDETPRRRVAVAAGVATARASASPWPVLPAEWSGEAEQMRLESP
jgi:hypothetical protein